jgi:hypothetical protein
MNIRQTIESETLSPSDGICDPPWIVNENVLRQSSVGLLLKNAHSLLHTQQSLLHPLIHLTLFYDEKRERPTNHFCHWEHVQSDLARRVGASGPPSATKPIRGFNFDQQLASVSPLYGDGAPKISNALLTNTLAVKPFVSLLQPS